MPFESLSFRYSFSINDFPDRWLPLIHIYDADLPLFPISYFHSISKQLPQGQRPNFTDRVFGYIEKLNSPVAGTIEIHIVCNKDLNSASNIHYKQLAEIEIKERLGINNPVTIADITNAFQGALSYANPVLLELWRRVVSDTYDNKLPFGRLWDEVFGLTRFVASWYSPGGRKGELIQTHYFASKFGELMQSGGGIPHVDFYLFPTIDEVIEVNNPLQLFPKYLQLVEVANLFITQNCTPVQVGNVTLSKFNNAQRGKLNTEKLKNIFNNTNIPHHLKPTATECFNTFDKGPQRTVIFLLMLGDIRNGRLNPRTINNTSLGSMYTNLGKTYQSPKVIHIYAQQCFGNASAMPIDIWMETLFQWPLNLYKSVPKKTKIRDILLLAPNLGKVERLLWVAVQARKVHSSACNNAIWCTKYASNKKARGANPLACKVCLTSIRDVCPAYEDIKLKEIVFNGNGNANQFEVVTSSNNNTTNNQKFTSCKGKSIYSIINDDFSAYDNPNGYAPFPNQNHDGSNMTVEEFIQEY